MSIDSPVRLAAAIAVILGTGLIVSLSGGSAAVAWLVVSAGLLALYLARRPRRLDLANVERRETLGRDELVALFEGLADPVLLLENARVGIANGAARQLLGDHIIGQDARLAIRHPAAAAVIAGEVVGPVDIVGLGARDQNWEIRGARFGSGGRIIQLTDRSQRVAAERARVDFVANASHELRTPLATLLGFIETLGDDSAGGDPATRARFLDVMEREARRMQTLVDDLISLSRIEAEKHQLPADPVDLATVIRNVISAQIGRDGAVRKDIRLDLADAVPAIAGDDRQLVQLVRNLVDNALKYGGSDEPVDVRLHCEGRMVELIVADHGPGIAPEHLPRLTERFYRVDAGRSREHGGTGLGLSIVKHIVERHRGQLLIDSRPGVGTQVTVLLPASEQPASP